MNRVNPSARETSTLGTFSVKDPVLTQAEQPLDHLLYHFTLTYSNWEFVGVCFSESFEAVSSGIQQAFWELGGVPRRHRSDSLSAAVNNLSEDREFRGRYRDLMDYYQVEPQRTNARRRMRMAMSSRPTAT